MISCERISGTWIDLQFVKDLGLDLNISLVSVHQILDVNMLLRKAACASTPKMEVRHNIEIR